MTDIIEYPVNTNAANPDYVVSLLAAAPGAIIAGGYARRVALGSVAPIAGDIDLFIFDDGPDDAALAAAGFLPNPAHPGTLAFPSATQFYDLPIQVVRRSTAIGGGTMPPWRTPWDVISTFGFMTEQFALTLVDGDLHVVTTDAAQRDTLDRRLVVNHIIDPVRLAYRANKYGQKGYTMTLAEMAGVFGAFMKLPVYQQFGYNQADSAADYPQQEG